MDRFMEWMVKDMRGGVGKFFRMGTNKKMERQAALLSLRKEFAAPSRSRATDPTTRGLGKVFCMTVSYCDEHGVWKRREKGRYNLTSERPKVTVEMIDMPVTGESRFDLYVDLRYK